MSTEKTQNFNQPQQNVTVKHVEVDPKIKMLPVGHDKNYHRFFIAENEKTISFVNYELKGDFIRILDTFTDPNYRGMGLAEKVTFALFQYAKENNLRIKSQDQYTKVYLSRHPDDKKIFECFEEPTGTPGTKGTGTTGTGTTGTMGTSSTTGTMGTSSMCTTGTTGSTDTNLRTNDLQKS